MPLPNTLPGMNSVGTIAAANSLNTGVPSRAEPEQQVRHEHRHEPRERLAEIDRHLLDVGIALPERIGGFDQRRAELLAEHRS